jgi:hypothetical protein
MEKEFLVGDHSRQSVKFGKKLKLDDLAEGSVCLRKVSITFLQVSNGKQPNEYSHSNKKPVIKNDK